MSNKVKGKRPTIAQCRVLKHYGYKDYEEWRYLGIRYSSPSGNKCPSRKESKIVELHFVNRNTDEELYLKE